MIRRCANCEAVVHLAHDNEWRHLGTDSWHEVRPGSLACVDPIMVEARSVFVYGTLRPGGGLHRQFDSMIARIASATLAGFELWGADRWFPKVAESRDPADVVVGDVLHFKPEAWPHALRNLCAVEGVPRLYRAASATVTLDDGAILTTGLFVPVGDSVRTSWGDRIESGDWFDEQPRQTDKEWRSA